MTRTIEPAVRIRGALRPPGDKSITHRGLLLGALADAGEETTLTGWLDGEDCRSTRRCLEALGVSIRDERPRLVIRGAGDRLSEPGSVLDAGNSGTTMRLLSGVLAGRPFGCTLTGDESLRSRPMARVADPLSAMGADLETLGDAGRAPLRFSPSRLNGIEYALPVASAQVKSCVLLAGLHAEGSTRVIEPRPSRDHTERMLKAMGADLTGEGLTWTLNPGRSLKGLDLKVPGDFSSAAFFIVLGTLARDADIVLEGVGLNPTRLGLLDSLKRMGADLEILEARTEGLEPVGDLRVRTSRLHGIEVGGDDVPRMIDELPLLVLAASLAEGETVIRDAAELRHKESDRIEATVRAVTALGGRVEGTRDGFRIRGAPRLMGGRAASQGDHRLAMVLAVGGILSENGVVVDGDEAVAVSYPAFFEDLASLVR